jgi:hypothetical protein
MGEGYFRKFYMTKNILTWQTLVVAVLGLITALVSMDDFTFDISECNKAWYMCMVSGTTTDLSIDEYKERIAFLEGQISILKETVANNKKAYTTAVLQLSSLTRVVATEAHTIKTELELKAPQASAIEHIDLDLAAFEEVPLSEVISKSRSQILQKLENSLPD